MDKVLVSGIVKMDLEELSKKTKSNKNEIMNWWKKNTEVKVREADGKKI